MGGAQSWADTALGVNILATLEKLASHVAVETPTVVGTPPTVPPVATGLVGGYFRFEDFFECFRGPLKMLWRVTCGPRAAICPPLP